MRADRRTGGLADWRTGGLADLCVIISISINLVHLFFSGHERKQKYFLDSNHKACVNPRLENVPEEGCHRTDCQS
jgi:hypothetical protein